MVGRHRPAYICTPTGREWHHYGASSDPGRYLYLGPCLEVDHPQGWPHDHELGDAGRGPDSKGMSRGR